MGEQGRRRRGRAGAAEAEERPCGNRTGGRRVGGVSRGRRCPQRRAASQVAPGGCGSRAPLTPGGCCSWDTGRVGGLRELGLYLFVG